MDGPTFGGYDDTTSNASLGGGTNPGNAATTTGIDPSQSTLSPNFDQYVYSMLGKAQGLAGLPYQEYTGNRFAGPSGLQQQGFQGIGAFQLPQQYQTATNFLTQAGQNAGSMGYGPSTFGNFYQPTQAYQPG